MYNEKMNPEDQIAAEESIAAMILDVTEQEIARTDASGGKSDALTQEDCQYLGRVILLKIIAQFRPDLTN